MKRLLITVFMGFLCVAVTPACAFDSTTPYLDTQLLPPQLLPPPPAEGSKDWRQQVDAVVAAQQGLSPKEIAAIRDEQRVRIEMIASVIGPDFTRDRLPKTFAFLDRVMHDSGQVVEADKKFFHTRRPYLTDSHVHLYVDRIDDSPAYPSGHTAESRVAAEVLGMLVPEKRAALRARAEAIAHHRVEAGAHYPVDLDGGRALAMIIVGALVANEDFQDDLVATRKEIAGK